MNLCVLLVLLSSVLVGAGAVDEAAAAAGAAAMAVDTEPEEADGDSESDGEGARNREGDASMAAGVVFLQHSRCFLCGVLVFTAKIHFYNGWATTATRPESVASS